MTHFTGLVCLCLLTVVNCASNHDILGGTLPCLPKSFGGTSVVCVCNATYCDTLPSTFTGESGQYEMYQTTKSGDRFRKTVGHFEKPDIPNAKVDATFTIHHETTYQSLHGFGGAFTDSAGINIMKLSAAAQDQLLSAYYSPKGIEYTLGRIPMASTDFSERVYSYDDVIGDFDLEHFALTKEDLTYKIPIFLRARQMSRRTINLFASPWSAPGWMKTSKQMPGSGSLCGNPGTKCYKTWANYFVRFLQEYKKHDINFWAVTIQNEPEDGLYFFFQFQAMAFTAEKMRDFIVSDLGPALKTNGLEDVKIIILDDNSFLLEQYANAIYSNPEANQYVAGAGVHWYLDSSSTPKTCFDPVHEKFPDKFILATEACMGSSLFARQKVMLGDWERAEQYAKSIIQDLQHWVTGWTDWNIALDMTGGPNWANNQVDSPIIVDYEKDLFYKQPMFYVMGHFSKFLPLGSVRIDLSRSDTNIHLQAVAFKTPDNKTVIVLNNRSDRSRTFSIVDEVHGVISGITPARSIQTFIWSQ